MPDLALTCLASARQLRQLHQKAGGAFSHPPCPCPPWPDSAEPLDGDLTRWVVNMVALEGPCAYVPIHLHLRIPPEYPDLPPTVGAAAGLQNSA